MGTCLEKQTRPSGKPDKDKEMPEDYSNKTEYFIQQTVALIAHETFSVSTNTAETLLLTYPFYSNSIDLLHAIKDRFFMSYSRYEFINSIETDSTCIQDPEQIPISSKIKLDYNDWITCVKIPIQQKCLDLLLKWMNKYWSEDFDINENNHEQIMKLLKTFIIEIKADRDKYDHKTYATFLQQYILRINAVINSREEWYLNIVRDIKNKHKQHEDLWSKQIQKSKNFTRNRIMSLENPIPPRSPSPSAIDKDVAQFQDDLFTELVNYENDENMDYNYTNVDIDEKEQQNDQHDNILSFLALKNQDTAREYAKQLTLVDWEYFSNISCRECLHKILSKNDIDKHKSIKLFIDRFQQINQYVIVSIIGASDLKTRIQMMEFFIYVAETLLKLNNLHSFTAVCSALDSYTIQKLTVVMEFLNKSTKRKLKEFLSPLCSMKKNYCKLREYCAMMKPPGIPFLGLILKDLTFANDGNKDILKKELDCHINFRKYFILNKICKDNIEHFSGTKYDTDEKNNDMNYTDESKGQNVVYMDLIADENLQNEILKDLNSYILLNKNVVRAMAKDANRVDLLHKEKYIKEQEVENKKRSGSKQDTKSKNIFQKLFSSSDDA
eukprot:488941_1